MRENKGKAFSETREYVECMVRSRWENFKRQEREFGVQRFEWLCKLESLRLNNRMVWEKISLEISMQFAWHILAKATAIMNVGKTIKPWKINTHNEKKTFIYRALQKNMSTCYLFCQFCWRESQRESSMVLSEGIMAWGFTYSVTN